MAKPNDTTTPPAVPRSLLVAVGVLALAVAASAFFPGIRLWGINHLAFYPLITRLAAITLIGVAFVPAVARDLHAGAEKITRGLSGDGRGARLALVVVPLVYVVMFKVGQVASDLLGDGQLIADSFVAAYHGNSEVIMRSTKAIVTEEYIAPGATMLYFWAGKIATGVFKAESPLVGLRALNFLLGGIFILFSLLALRSKRLSPGNRMWLMFMLLFATSLELFFGYIENYSALLLFTLLYVISALRSLHRDGPVWQPIVLFVLMFYTHVQAVMFAPSLLLVLAWRFKKEPRAAMLSTLTPALMVLVVAGAIVLSFHTSFGEFYLPLRGTSESYGILSPVHWLDVGNELLMLSPILPLFIVMMLVTRRRRKDAKPRRQPAGASWFTQRIEWHFAIVMLIPCLVYLLVLNAEIGMARDWDLFSMTTAPLVVLILLIRTRFAEPRFAELRGLGAGASARLVAPAMMITLVLGVSWFGINASSGRTTDRLESILSYDKSHAPYGYENLAIHYREVENRVDKAIEMMERACDISHNPRQYVRLAMYYDDDGNTEHGIELMEQVLARRPDFQKARYRHVLFLEKTKQWNKLLDSSRAATRYHPDVAIYYFYLGEMLLLRGEVQEGLQVLRKCKTLKPPKAAIDRINQRLIEYQSFGKENQKQKE